MTQTVKATALLPAGSQVKAAESRLPADLSGLRLYRIQLPGSHQVTVITPNNCGNMSEDLRLFVDGTETRIPFGIEPFDLTSLHHTASDGSNHNVVTFCQQ